jgi:hypothetical protein
VTPFLRISLALIGGDGEPETVPETDLDCAAVLAMAALWPEECPTTNELADRCGTRAASAPHVLETWMLTEVV